MTITTGNQPDVMGAIFHEAATDDAGVGWCARGVGNILESINVSHTRGNAHTWKNSLPANGWQLMEGVRPEDAPPGAVLVYDRNRNYQGLGGGREYGHVEIVAERNGERYYVSDKARTNWGGSVPQNFVGVYVHPELDAACEATPLSREEIMNLSLTENFSQRQNSSSTVSPERPSETQVQVETAETQERKRRESDASTTTLLNNDTLSSVFEAAQNGNLLEALMELIAQLFNLDNLSSPQNTAKNDQSIIVS